MNGFRNKALTQLARVFEGMEVAIQGEIGSFSEEAAQRLGIEDLRIRSCRQFDEAFSLTASGQIDACLIPIENSLAGSIHRNFDLLRRYGLKIQKEIYLRIEHNLIVLPGVKFEDLTTVISHPVALQQCEQFFESNPHLRMRTSYDTSGSVKELVERKEKTWGAIAGRRAAELSGTEVIRFSIEDSKENYTRFVLLGRDFTDLEGANKTSVVFSFENAPGALFKSLGVFALRDIDLTKIESRPIRGRPWEYLFYLDILGSIEDEKVKNALNHLRELADSVEILGCYVRDESVSKRGM